MTLNLDKNRLRAATGVAVLTAIVSGAPVTAQADDDGKQRVQRVLLLSVDGLHRQDLARWVAQNPQSALAKLSRHGVTYTNARTSTPSDSFPGMLAQLTGGSPKSTGVYYDDSYDRTLYSPGPAGCGQTQGSEIVLDESVDYDSTKLFSGGMNPANLPQQLNADLSCTKVFPHDFVKVNTIFGVAHAAGLQTAWSDKHPAYDIVNGPYVGTPNVDDLYTPEINSNIYGQGGPASANGVDLIAPAAACDATNSTLAYPPPPNGTAPVQYVDCAPTTEAYDDVKVQAIINEIDGKRSDGSPGTGKAPAIFGMNFQAVSVGEKLVAGGYDATLAPKPILQHAIAHTDASIGRMVAELKAKGLYDNTLIIVSAKHGQSPIKFAKLQMEPKATQAPDHTVVDPGNVINAPVDQQLSSYVNPNSGSQYAQSGHLQTDDVGIVWLQPNGATDLTNAVDSLVTNGAAIHATTLPHGTIFPSNITSGAALTAIYGDPTVPGSLAAARAPDILIQPDEGVIYSGSKKKIAEHGGGASGDTGVALLVSASFLEQESEDDAVQTKQIAPTILKALGLNPQALQAVQQEGTRVLPDVLDD